MSRGAAPGISRWVEVSPGYGWVCEPYRVGKVYLDGCSLFEVWHEHRRIGTTDDFAAARALARKHHDEHLQPGESA